MAPLLLLTAALAVALAVVAREWLVLRSRQRQRGLFRRWPIPQVSLAEFDERFAPGEFGPARETEVHFLGRGEIIVPGGTSDTESWILAVLARNAMQMFEFGTCTGKTAYLWARNQPAGGRVTTLTLAPSQLGDYQRAAGDDTFATDSARAESAFTRFVYTGTAEESRITQLYGDSKRFDESPYLDGCDVVFVDGSHAYSYVVSDSAKAIRMVRPGGVVLWHDYRNTMPGVFRALNELAGRLSLVHLRGTDLVAWRRST